MTTPEDPVGIGEPRFDSKISVEQRIEGFTPCWIWTAFTQRGYGRFARKNRGGMVKAHRYAWEALNGPIPPGLTFDHLCRVTQCVNPAHGEIVTSKENILRGNSASATNARKTHCPQGHPLAGENLRVYQGARNCATCLRARDARRRAAK